MGSISTGRLQNRCFFVETRWLCYVFFFFCGDQRTRTSKPKRRKQTAETMNVASARTHRKHISQANKTEI